MKSHEEREGCSPENLRDAAWELTSSKVRGTVLDAGSGDGAWLRRLMTIPAAKEFIALDIVDKGAGSVPGARFHAADLAKDRLPVDDNSVDWVFAIEVLEHLPNPRHFVAEVHRVLRPGGSFFLSTPSVDSLTARLSYLVRGYFPPFADHSYVETGHITPVSELDVRRMAAESKFSRVEFSYPLPGRIPMSARMWPVLRGKLWTETMFATLVK